MKCFLAVLALLTFLTQSCSLKKPVISIVGDIAWDGQAVLEREADVDLAREQTPALIAALAVLRFGHPKDRTFAALVAKAYGQYAYGFYEEDLLVYGQRDSHYGISRERASRFYLKGKEVGLTALARKNAFARALSAPQPEFERALRSFGKKDGPLLFWTAFCWGGWMNLHRDDPAAIIDFPRVSVMLDRVRALLPQYAYGSVHTFRGVLDASRPPMLGGNPARAKAAFEQAITAESRYLIHKVLYAEYYAVQVQDRALFERLLAEVIGTDAAAFPEQRLANELAKRRAKLLLERVTHLF